MMQMGQNQARRCLEEVHQVAPISWKSGNYSVWMSSSECDSEGVVCYLIVLSHWPHVATHVATQVAQLVARHVFQWNRSH